MQLSSFTLGVLLVPLIAAAAGPAEDGDFRLWTGPPIPESVHDIPYLDVVTHVRLHEAKAGEYQFLHGASIIEHEGTLFACWANSPVDENSRDEVVRGRRSTDGGMTWGPVEVIAPGFPDTLERHSHAPFLSHDGELWAFAARWGIGEGKRFAGLKVEAFVLDEQENTWHSRGIVARQCWPYNEPVRMANGNWITGGQDEDARPCVMFSYGDDLTAWDTVKIPVPDGIPISFGETTVLPEKNHVLAIIRPRSPKRALVAESEDFGRTWSPCRPSNLPMSDAKPYAGQPMQFLFGALDEVRLYRGTLSEQEVKKLASAPSSSRSSRERPSEAPPGSLPTEVPFPFGRRFWYTDVLVEDYGGVAQSAEHRVFNP